MAESDEDHQNSSDSDSPEAVSFSSSKQQILDQIQEEKLVHGG